MDILSFALGFVAMLLISLVWRDMHARYRSRKIRAPREPYDSRIDKIAPDAPTRYAIHIAHHRPYMRQRLAGPVKDKAAAVLEWSDDG